MTNRHLRPLLALALFLAIVAPTVAEEFGRIPYTKIAEAYDRTVSLDPRKAQLSVIVEPKDKAVKISDVTLFIDSKAKGRIPLLLDEGGVIRNFPRDEVLRRENPFVVTNQPKGSLSMGITLVIPVPDALSFPYARLAEGVAEANRLIKEQAGLLSLVIPSPKGVALEFASRSPAATVTVAAKSGSNVLTADAEGVVKVKIDPKLVEENPQVTVSSRPRRIAVNQ